MKHGEHIPKDKRDDMARIAVGMLGALSQSEARRVVAGMFDVSETTARNLISRGKFLRVNASTSAPAVQGEG